MKLFLSDIHGNIKALEFLKEIPEYKDESSEVIFVGDYVDGFNLDAGAIEKTITFVYDEVQSGKAVALMGNHDYEFVQFLSFNQPPYGWINSMGGDETLASMNIQKWQPPELIRNQVRKKLSIEVVRWIRDLPYFYQSNNLLAVHAGFNLRELPENNSHYKMIWIREPYFNYKHFSEINEFYKDKVIVTGHTPNPYIMENVYGPIVRTNRITQYFIDGASKGSPRYSGQINLLILSDEGEYLKSYALKEDGYTEISLTPCSF